MAKRATNKPRRTTSNAIKAAAEAAEAKAALAAEAAPAEAAAKAAAMPIADDVATQAAAEEEAAQAAQAAAAQAAAAAEGEAAQVATAAAEASAVPRQRTRQDVQHSTPKQPTQGHAQGSNGAPSNGFIGYNHPWMFDNAFAQHRHHKCVKGKSKCTEASCEWWVVKIICHGGKDGILVRYYDLSGDEPKAERWGDQHVDVLSLRPKDKEEESQNSVAKNLDGGLRLAQPKVVGTGSGLHQQHKQLQAPMQQQQQQPQTTPQQQEGELVDTTDGVTEHQHRAAQQQQLQQQQATLQHKHQNLELESGVPSLADPDVYDRFIKMTAPRPQNTADSVIDAAGVAEQQVDEYQRQQLQGPNPIDMVGPSITTPLK